LLVTLLAKVRQESINIHSVQYWKNVLYYLLLQHNILKNRTCVHFTNNDISVLIKNSCNSVQKQTVVSSFSVRMHFVKTFTSTVVKIKIYHRHISSVRNLTLTCCCSEVTSTGNIHYCSDFGVVQSSQTFCGNAED
jgi:hypothetical protein